MTSGITYAFYLWQIQCTCICIIILFTYLSSRSQKEQWSSFQSPGGLGQLAQMDPSPWSSQRTSHASHSGEGCSPKIGNHYTMLCNSFCYYNIMCCTTIPLALIIMQVSINYQGFFYATNLKLMCMYNIIIRCLVAIYCGIRTNWTLNY